MFERLLRFLAAGNPPITGRPRFRMLPARLIPSNGGRDPVLRRRLRASIAESGDCFPPRSRLESRIRLAAWIKK
jgi:hypothetical protein